MFAALAFLRAFAPLREKKEAPNRTPAMPLAKYPLPMSLDEARRNYGWDEFDVILVSGDAYIDHPAFGAGIIGRWLEHLGLRVGIIAQPDWRGTADFKKLGRPKLFFGVTAGNLDSQ